MRLREPVGDAVVVGGDESVDQERGQGSHGLIGIGDATTGAQSCPGGAGHELTGVDGLLDSRSIRRFTDPAAAVALTLNENALPRREWEAAWDGLEVEIIPFDDVAP